MGHGYGLLCQHALAVQELCFQRGFLGLGTGYVDGQCGRSFGVVVGQGRRAEEEIVDARLGSAPEVDVAGDARQSPVVLTLEERAACEAVDTHADIVHARAYLICYLEFARQVGVLGIAYELAVDPNVVAVAGTIEADENVAPFPVLGQRELTAV